MYETDTERQLTYLNHMDSAQSEITHATQNARNLAQKLLHRGFPADTQLAHNTLEASLDNSMASLAARWHEYSHAAKKHRHLSHEHDQSGSALAKFMSKKDEHDAKIRGLEKQIQEMARQLLQFQREHVDQHPRNVAAKNEAVARASKDAEGRRVLDATVAYSTFKAGHERFGAMLAARTQELFDVGVELQEMKGVETKLRTRVQRLHTRKFSAGFHLGLRNNAHVLARMRVVKKFEAMCAFVEVVGGENAVVKAKKSLLETVRVYDGHPDMGYPWACEQVRGEVEVLEEMELMMDSEEEGCAGGRDRSREGREGTEESLEGHGTKGEKKKDRKRLKGKRKGKK
ncbi:MAG: hypothetical protein Q9219_005720 [cf. Caloplaca sp. 3 TL-2023]